MGRTIDIIDNEFIVETIDSDTDLSIVSNALKNEKNF